MKNKIFSIFLVFVMVVFVMTISASALSFTATMVPSSTTVQEATEFTVTVKVSNLDVGTNGINSLTGYLKYDTDVFETISESSIEGLNSWSVTYDASTGKIGLTKINFVTSTQDVFQIAFKTKSGVTGKSGTISYTNITASNSESDIPATDISTSITVGTPDANSSNTTNTITNISVINANTTANVSNNSVSNNTVNNTTNTNVVSSYVNTSTNTSSNSNMPDTGINDTIFYLILVIVAIAIVFYIKIEKLNKDMK